MKIIIVGGGKVGSYLGKFLLENEHDVKVIESDDKLFGKLEEMLPKDRIIHASGSNPSVLEAAGISSVDVLATVSDRDEKNLVVSTLAKMEFGVPKVVARVNNPKNAWLFDSGMGVDISINQADIIAQIIADELNLHDMSTLLQIGRGEFSIVHIQVAKGSVADGVTLKELKVPQQCLIISVTRNYKTFIPKYDTKFEHGDNLVMFTDKQHKEELEQLFIESNNN